MNLHKLVTTLEFSQTSKVKVNILVYCIQVFLRSFLQNTSGRLLLHFVIEEFVLNISMKMTYIYIYDLYIRI